MNDESELNNDEINTKPGFCEPKISGSEEKLLNLLVEIIVKILIKEVK